jgi:hypothetical protein
MMELTGYQVKQINDFMGGDYDTSVTVEHLPERTLDPGTGDEPTTMPAGLYIWCTDYPEEGAVLLDPVDPDTIGEDG